MKPIFNLTWKDGCEPIHQTRGSVCADLIAAEDVFIPFMDGAKLIDTGVKIESVNWDVVPDGFIPEIQIRARSGLALHGILLANGIGTVDPDYRDNIKVALLNAGRASGYWINRGRRVAQFTFALRPLTGCAILEHERNGGFHSTGES